MGDKTSSRDRMLAGAIALIRERGVAGVTVDAIVSRSNAPRGSVYYHFPDGRSQIVREAIFGAHESVSLLVASGVNDATSAREAIGLVAQFWKRLLLESDFQAGCPFVAATADGFSSDPELREPVAQHFAMWEESLYGLLAKEGREPEPARRKARLVMSAFSGAVLLCRAHRSLEPLDDVLDELSQILG